MVVLFCIAGIVSKFIGAWENALSMPYVVKYVPDYFIAQNFVYQLALYPKSIILSVLFYEFLEAFQSVHNSCMSKSYDCNHNRINIIKVHFSEDTGSRIFKGRVQKMIFKERDAMTSHEKSEIIYTNT